MFKAVALLARKPELTREQFIEHYETVHAPLILRSFPTLKAYRRNFVDLTDSIRAPGVADPSFDVITEMWFEDRAGYDAMLAAHADPAIGGPVAEDANLFLDMSRTLQFIVDER
ncbi:EthD domain-containing protein [Rhodococcus sp. TAF43]|uniref:EthD domain-containing protein n=1 Tax=unclassified Rhodococcus (in: high G+C Gram-positive bacteria) TaxID=192944 RepID=UPI0015823C69|nr:EthD domain-containing protein [Rhodococcus sp. W8901]QKT13535.1 EthD domain-containing protein [Rhodococcus sp. W8901]